uniref:Uncharacterized protein n=1 Tax=Romanomermis culicivorax TaxID=13658 RepID=A0A915I314_ROMCU
MDQKTNELTKCQNAHPRVATTGCQYWRSSNKRRIFSSRLKKIDNRTKTQKNLDAQFAHNNALSRRFKMKARLGLEFSSFFKQQS